jgi:hypothetical protein
MVIPEVTIDKEAGKPAFVWVAGSDDPLAQLTPTIRDDVRIERGCEVCAYTGHDLWAWGDGLSAPCPECGALDAPLVPYTDADGDAWLDGIERAAARWSGGKRPLEQVTTLVMHRYSRGRHGARPALRAESRRAPCVLACDRARRWVGAAQHAAPAGHRDRLARRPPPNQRVPALAWRWTLRRAGKVHDPYDGESIKELVSLVSKLARDAVRICATVSGTMTSCRSAAAIRARRFRGMC